MRAPVCQAAAPPGRPSQWLTWARPDPSHVAGAAQLLTCPLLARFRTQPKPKPDARLNPARTAPTRASPPASAAARTLADVLGPCQVQASGTTASAAGALIAAANAMTTMASTRRPASAHATPAASRPAISASLCPPAISVNVTSGLATPTAKASAGS